MFWLEFRRRRVAQNTGKATHLSQPSPSSSSFSPFFSPPLLLPHPQWVKNCPFFSPSPPPSSTVGEKLPLFPKQAAQLLAIQNPAAVPQHGQIHHGRRSPAMGTCATCWDRRGRALLISVHSLLKETARASPAYFSQKMPPFPSSSSPSIVDPSRTSRRRRVIPAAEAHITCSSCPSSPSSISFT